MWICQKCGNKNDDVVDSCLLCGCLKKESDEIKLKNNNVIYGDHNYHMKKGK